MSKKRKKTKPSSRDTLSKLGKHWRRDPDTGRMIFAVESRVKAKQSRTPPPVPDRSDPS
jgi:hypothetical protein